jgi:hypothetical protein
MKYELINKKVSTEVDIDEETYQVDIHLSIKPDTDLVPSFIKVITVVSNNAQTGYEVDEQRTNEINSYLSEINK